MNQSEVLIEIVNKIAEKNSNLVLSGSLALDLQGVQLRRTPKDIDIVNPNFFVPIDGMKRTTKYDFVEGRREYEDEDAPEEERLFEITNYEYRGISIDLFVPNVPGLFPKNKLVKNPKVKAPLLQFQEIIKYKIEHAFASASTRAKHRNDIIHALVNIEKTV